MVTKTLNDYRDICFLILTNSTEPITFSQMVNLIQGITVDPSYSEISAALRNLVAQNFLKEIESPDYLVELANHKSHKKSGVQSYSINEKIISLIEDARKSSIDYDYQFTDMIPLSTVRFFDYLRQNHVGLIQCDQCVALIAGLEFDGDASIFTPSYYDYLRNYKEYSKEKDSLYHLFADNKSKFRLKSYSLDKSEKLIKIYIYILPGVDRNYPDCTKELETLYTQMIPMLTEKYDIQIFTEKI